ncbi:MAG: EAL domain-containing protein [Pseudomonadales bacterium]
MGKTMDLTVTAEGIESADNIEMLKSFGCDIGQGFYYSLPLNAGEIPAFVSDIGQTGTI